jgi:pimeloyl-ACP methyl ester carboxylesterase
MAKTTTAPLYYAQSKSPPIKAMKWAQKGQYVRWTSTLPENEGHEALNIFTVCLGDKARPALVLVHGYPTSSYDFQDLLAELGDEFYLCLLDTPGYGFSDKPRGGYRYSLFDDAKLVDHLIKNHFGLKQWSLLTHDKGNSVGLCLLGLYQGYADKPYEIKNHVILNGNIYLPLANLSLGQKALLHPVSGRILQRALSGRSLAKGLWDATFTGRPDLGEIAALASIFDYQDGVRIQHELIQYLNERRVHEVEWLETLKKSDIPTTLIWGELDRIAPTRVADYVWRRYLSVRQVPSSYWRVPLANHYLQNDQPKVLAELVKYALGAQAKPDFQGAAGQPYEVREYLP